MFEAPRHHGVVSTEDAQGVVVRVLQQQTQAEAMVTLVVGGDGQLRGIKKNILYVSAGGGGTPTGALMRLCTHLVEDIPELRQIHILHQHQSVEETEGI